ncbi:unnamed protein product [Dicrocoelium dendriticum]|nr:unnamed protein product [Dicrocoelium dendriticum]
MHAENEEYRHTVGRRVVMFTRTTGRPRKQGWWKSGTGATSETRRSNADLVYRAETGSRVAAGSDAESRRTEETHVESTVTQTSTSFLGSRTDSKQCEVDAIKQIMDCRTDS